jgi:hypothetical protein
MSPAYASVSYAIPKLYIAQDSVPLLSLSFRSIVSHHYVDPSVVLVEITVAQPPFVLRKQTSTLLRSEREGPERTSKPAKSRETLLCL